MKKHIDILKKIQTKYPDFIVVGSLALFLNNIALSRFKNFKGDIDIVSLTNKYKSLKSESSNEGVPSGNDFQESFKYNGVKIDTVWDANYPFIEVDYDGFRFKVSDLNRVMFYKINYAIKGSQKHIDDIDEILPQLYMIKNPSEGGAKFH
jgi:hypothetical protein